MTDLAIQQLGVDLGDLRPEDVLLFTQDLPAPVEPPAKEEQPPSYEWFRPEHGAQVARWLEAGATSARAGLPTEFFVDAIDDLYYYDRACRAAAVVESEPIRRKDIPPSITRNDVVVPPVIWPGLSSDPLPARVVEPVTYSLVEKKFRWSKDTPRSAVDAAARVLAAEPPDRLWIAEYVQKEVRREKYDPIIYAEYGDWQVEVARWD